MKAMISIEALKAAGGSLDDAIKTVEAKKFIIKRLFAREILDSCGNPTVDVDLVTESGISLRSAVPSGAMATRAATPARVSSRPSRPCARSSAQGRRCLEQKALDAKMVLPVPVVLPVPCFKALNNSSHAGNELAF